MGKINFSSVDEWLDEDNLMLIESWARDGYTRNEIADMMGIKPSLLSRWAVQYKEIAEALRKGRELIDYKVENALLKSALGFTTKDIEVTLGKQKIGGKSYEITKKTIIREVAPNVTACLAWLNNRRPDKWRRNRDKEVIIDEEDSNLTVTIVRADDESLKGTNKEVKVQNKKNIKEEKSNDSNDEQEQSGYEKVTSKKEFDKDYWPDDWEDEDE